MSTPKGPRSVGRCRSPRTDAAAVGPQVLQPSGWPMPKGYANGMAADGRLVVTGGVIGWDTEGHLPDGFHRAGASDAEQHFGDPRARVARSPSISCA